MKTPKCGPRFDCAEHPDCGLKAMDPNHAAWRAFRAMLSDCCDLLGCYGDEFFMGMNLVGRHFLDACPFYSKQVWEEEYSAYCDCEILLNMTGKEG